MDHIPQNMRMAAAKMSNRNQNRFRLETVSSDTARAGRIITVNLPENALIDTKSLTMQMKVAATGGTVNTVVAFGRLPADASSLISRVEVYVNGVQVMGGASEYGVISRILKIGRCSSERDRTIDRALSHSAITGDNSNETVTIMMTDWKGFLGECGCRFLPTDLIGNVQIRITFAGNEVIVPKITGELVGAALNNADKRAAAALCKYEVSDIFFTVDTIQVDEMYHTMLRERLSNEGEIRLMYKEYYSWSVGGHTGSACNTRFSLSSGSIDKLYAVMRDSNHQTVGTPATTMTPAFGDTFVAAPFCFVSMSDNSTSTTEGDLRAQWSINNTLHPQFRAGCLNAIFDQAYCNDKVYDQSGGTLLSSMSQFHTGMAVFALRLNHPGEPISVMSGYDSKGVNSQMSINFEHLTVPTASANTGVTATYSTFVVAETTAQLVIGLGRSVAVSY